MALAACGAREIASEGAGVSPCARCHGSDASGVPPLDTHGSSDTTHPGVGAHTAHMRARIECNTCHAVPPPGDLSHVDGKARLVWGPRATGNGTASPSYDAGGTHACTSVYCHGSFPGGNLSNAPLWTGTGQHQADCGTCHLDASSAGEGSGHPSVAAGSTNAICAVCHPDTVDASGAIRADGTHLDGLRQVDGAARHPAGWTTPSSDAFHGIAAALAPLTCNRCHAIRRPAAVTDVTCADCHLGGQAWTTTCNGCHGEAGDPRGAPPADVRGRTAISAVGVGAHRRHVDSTALSAPLGCVFCHRGYADVYDPGHLDGTPAVTSYQGTDAAWIAAGRDPGWNPTAATCATSYCHSAYAPANAPVWTAPRANACGTCHGLPPAGAHPAVGSDLATCSVCHPDTMTADGRVIPPPAGRHLDGHVTVSGGHVSSWMDPSSPEFHAFAADRGLSPCQTCHGAALDGGFTGVACAGCHEEQLPPGVATWSRNCVMCHGGGNDSSGAPPRTIWGYQADAVRVGAHAAHLGGGTLGRAVPCATCHVLPASAFAAGHVDLVTGSASPTASVTFSGLAVVGGAASWDRASRGCTVYCHGAGYAGTPAQGSDFTPDWTGGAAEVRCGACHAVPPGGAHPPSPRCGSCHAGYGATSVNLDTHVDGVVEPPTLGCASCHGDASRPATARNPQLAAAPPYGTHGELAPTERAVGAHLLHLTAGALSNGIACEECHATVTSFGVANGHRNGTVELAWGPIASAGIDPGVIGWQGGRCSATYCHGNFRLGNPANAPSWTAPVAVACGTCHGIPPGGTHPASTACGSCHTGYSSTVVNRDTHVNGVLDVTGGGHAASWMDASSPDFHAFSADRGLAACQGCHGAALDGGFTGVGCARCHDAALPAGVTTWSQNCVMCHGGGSDGTGAPPRTIWGYQSDVVRVGAHAAHLAGGALAGPIACSTCHVRPSSAFSDGHIDLVAGAAAPTASVTFSGVAAVGGAGTWDRASRGCTVYCHGAGFAGTPAQGSNSVPDWTGGAGEATCGSCHALPPGGTHPANPLCGSCHAGYGATTVNLGTHLNGVVDAPVLGCASCHGDASRPATALNPQLPAAPPSGTHGETAPTERAVGAHQLHLTAGALSNGIACGECHAPVTSGGVGGGHRNGTVELAWGPIASAGIDAAVITWQDGRCSGTYCHGNFRLGNPLNAPTWTAPSAGACGSCHGLPPGGSHPASSACGSCHPGYDATSVNRDTHVNGVLDVTGGGGHAASWMDASSPEFHAFSADRGLSACQGCHGATLEGGFTGVACASCHDRQLPAGVTSWIRNCVMCHGGGNDGTGAPPRTIWGQQADPVRVGAHAAHLAGGPLARPIACATCHVPPADAFAAGHIDLVAGSAVPTASVVFSGVAAVGGAGSWDRAARGCTVYCHGAAFAGTPAQGSHSTPDWTGGAGEATCGSCHALPPGGSHPANPQCGSCHVGYGAASVNLDTHLNGVVEAPALGCTSCHGDASRPATALNPQLPAAPPYGTHGETAPSDRAVGAHQLHLTAGPLSNGVSCQECHAPVTSVGVANGHRNGAVDLVWGPIASAGIDAGTIAWQGGTCSATYCHGNFRLGYPLNAPSWTAPVADSCGTCHGLPPGGGHPASVECGSCHLGYGPAFVNRDTHVNGLLDVQMTCTSCHGDATRQPVAPACGSDAICTDPNVQVAPPITASGRPAGAHVAHVNPSTVRAAPVRCAECHRDAVPPASASHLSGLADVRFGGRATSGGAAPSYVPGAGCAATYCHGNYSGTFEYSVWDWGADEAVIVTVSYAGAMATPSWTDGPMTCGSCHGAPPGNGDWHGHHGSLPQHRECQLCHPDATSVNGVPTAITNPALHVNGTVDVTPRWGSACFGCH